MGGKEGGGGEDGSFYEVLLIKLILMQGVVGVHVLGVLIRTALREGGGGGDG